VTGDFQKLVVELILSLIYLHFREILALELYLAIKVRHHLHLAAVKKAAQRFRVHFHTILKEGHMQKCAIGVSAISVLAHQKRV